MVGEGVFRTCADRPAGLGVPEVQGLVRRRAALVDVYPVIAVVQIGKGNAAGAVDQQARGCGHTETGANRGLPIRLERDAAVPVSGIAAVDARQLAVRLGAEDKFLDLP